MTDEVLISLNGEQIDRVEYQAYVERKIAELPDFREVMTLRVVDSEGYYGYWDDETIIRGEE